MHIDLHGYHNEDRELRESLLKRARFAVRRFAQRIPRTKIKLYDINGPRGGTDKCCRVELYSQDGRVTVARSNAGTWTAALDLALDRAMQILRRRWRQSRQSRRSRFKTGACKL